MSLLNREQILERLDNNKIFLSETWREEQLRPAGYDLRISPEVRAFNDTIFEPGRRYGETLLLNPGDTALVLSYEQFCMPWDLAANLGIRFRFARRGLSVLTGLLVDPGYGMKRIANGWRSKGSALHFFVVNTGADSIPIVLGEDGDAVLSVQFLETEELKEKEETPPPNDVEPSSALWAFHNMRALREEVEEERSGTAERLKDMEADLSQLEAVIETTRSATENIVVFGVFLVAVTLIGVSVTTLFQTLAGSEIGAIVDNLNRIHLQGLSATLVVLAAIFAIGASVIALILALTKGFARVFAKRVVRSVSHTDRHRRYGRDR